MSKQKNFRMKEEQLAMLETLSEMGFSETNAIKAGLKMYYNYALENPGDAALLAMRA